MSKASTPYKQDIVNPTPRTKKSFKEKNIHQRLVETNEEPQELPFIDERYDVIDLIGCGGMGSVYKVLDKQTQIVLAIKLIKPELAVDQSALKRFEQEVEATRGLTHPNLVSTLSSGRTPDGAPYLVMEFVEGEDLSTIIRREGRMTSDRVLGLWMQVCEALTCAHENGIIHRDIKPTNIIVSKNENGIETARLVDFGIAKILTAQSRETRDLTETGAVFGNPYYMSPEHCLSFKMDKRSDVYSLGCLMYELLTGKPPFADSNPVHVIVKHINDDAPPFSADAKRDLNSALLEEVTLRCLEKQVESRYQSISEIKKDLDLISEGKRPAKHKRRRVARPQFSKGQIGAAIIAFSVLLYSRAMTGGWSEQIFTLLIFSGVGFITFLIASIEQLKNLAQGNINPRNCWRTAFLVSLTLMCFFSMPDNAYNLYAEKMPWLTAHTQVIALLLKLCVYSTVIAAIGCIAFRSSFKTSALKIAAQLAGVISALILITSTIFPKWTAEELMHFCILGKSVESKAPWVTENLSRYAVLVDQSNSSAVIKLADSLANRAQFQQSEKLLDAYIARETDKQKLANVYFKKSKIHMRSGQTNLAVENMHKAVTLLPRLDYLDELAFLHWELGNNDQALKYFGQATVLQPGTVAPFCGRALVYSSTGEYAKAIKELDGMAKLEDDQISVFFLRGLLRQKIHDPGATADFKHIIERDADPMKRSQQGMSICEVKLRVAYAFKILSDEVNFQKKIDEAHTYSYGSFDRFEKELKNSCKRANLELRSIQTYLD